MSKRHECAMCDNTKPLTGRKAAHHYKESGLKNVTLAEVTVFRCDKCGAESFHIPNMDALHFSIAQILLKKGSPLIGDEVRFLRKVLGYTSKMFARILSCDPKHLSRIENSDEPCTKSFDRLVRFAYASSKKPDLDYDLHDQILAEEELKLKRIKATPVGRSGWVTCAA